MSSIMKFWMLFIEGRGGPTYKHGTYESARSEAERLVAKHGLPVVVLEARQVARLAGVTWDEVPVESGDLPEGGC